MDQSVKTLPSDGGDGRGWIGRIIIAVILGEAIWALIVSVMNNVVVPWLGDVMGQSGGLPTSFTQRPYNYPDLFVSIFEFCIACLVAAILNYFFQRPRTVRVRSAKSAVPAAPARAMGVIPQSVATPPPTSAPINQAAPVRSALLQPDFPRTSEAKPNVPQLRVSQPSVAQVNPAPAPSPVPPSAPVMKPQPVIPSTPAGAAPASPTPAPAARPVVAATPPPAASANAAVQEPLPAKPKAEPAKPKKPKQVYYNIVGEPMPSDED
jgi:large-conductance mechanosensitive channel